MEFVVPSAILDILIWVGVSLFLVTLIHLIRNTRLSVGAKIAFALLQALPFVGPIAYWSMLALSRKEKSTTVIDV